MTKAELEVLLSDANEKTSRVETLLREAQAYISTLTGANVTTPKVEKFTTTVYTLGYGGTNRNNIDELLKATFGDKSFVLTDIRSYPVCQYNPEFTNETFVNWKKESYDGTMASHFGKHYCFKGDVLGNAPKLVGNWVPKSWEKAHESLHAISRFIEKWGDERPVVLFCSEKQAVKANDKGPVSFVCHRAFVAERLQLLMPGLKVKHLVAKPDAERMAAFRASLSQRRVAAPAGDEAFMEDGEDMTGFDQG